MPTPFNSSTIDLSRVGPMPPLPGRDGGTFRTNQPRSGIANVSTVSNGSYRRIPDLQLDRNLHHSNSETHVLNRAAFGTDAAHLSSGTPPLPVNIALALTYIRNHANLDGECGSTLTTHLDAIERVLDADLRNPRPVSIKPSTDPTDVRTSKSGSLRRSFVSRLKRVGSSFISKRPQENHPKPNPASRPLPATPNVANQQAEVDYDGYEIPRTDRNITHPIESAEHSSHVYAKIEYLDPQASNDLGDSLFNHTYEEIENRGLPPSGDENDSALDHTYEVVI